MRRWFGGPSSLGAHRCPSRPVGCCCGHHGSRVVDQQPAWIGWLLTFVGLVTGYFYPPVTAFPLTCRSPPRATDLHTVLPDVVSGNAMPVLDPGWTLRPRTTSPRQL